MSTETETVPGTQSFVQQRFTQAIELEKQLRFLIESKGPLGLNVWDLRCKIRESYETIILEDHEFAEAHDVEQALWRLHYKQIEDFRMRIRKSMAATGGATSVSVIPMPGAKNATRNEPVHKVLASFKSFLSEAKGFYHELILKLRAKHGLPQDLISAEGDHYANDQNRAANLKGCQLSCHRCLIYLGDLARYKELHGDGDSKNHDWSVAAGYYLKAVSLWPASGNPHNQLAVLATYVGDELLAVYRYFRSLAVETPFVTARDNLILLFEKNRQFYTQLSASTNEMNSQASKISESAKIKGGKTLLIGDGLKLAVKDHKQHNTGDYADLMSETRKRFRASFVRLNGILFTKTSLETFPEVYATTVCELEQLLALDDMCLEAGLGSEHRSGIGTGSSGAAGVLQLVCMLIFTVHNANGSNTVQQPTYAEVLQRSALLQNAFTAAFECTGRLMRRCADSNDVCSSPFLPAMLVFMEWLACRPEIAVGSEVDERQANARFFFWMQCVTLLNKLYKSGDLDSSVGLGTVNSLGTLDGGGNPLWEDYELQGFVPLVPVQMALDYSISPVRVGMRDRKEQQVRVRRIMAAGNALRIAFEGTGKGIAYDEETDRFCMAEELKQRNKNELIAAGGQTSVKQEIGYHQHVTGGFKDESATGCRENRVPVKDVFPKSVHGDEDDEEYIVFKPVPKDMPAVQTVHISANRKSGEVSVNASSVSVSDAQDKIRLDNSEISSNFHELSPASVSHGKSQFSTGLISDFPLHSRVQSDQMGSKLAVPPSQVVTGFHSAASTLPSLLGMPNSFGMVSIGPSSLVQQGELKGNPLNFGSPMNMSSMLYSEDLPSSSGDPLYAFASSPLTTWGFWNSETMFAGGLVKTNSPGVIGQQKQADLNPTYMNSEVEFPSLTGLSSLSINDPTSTQPVVGSSGAASKFTGLAPHRDIMDCPSIDSSLLVDPSYSALRPYPSAPLLLDENIVNMPDDVVSSSLYLNQSTLDQAIMVNAQAKDGKSALLMQPEYCNARKDSVMLSVPNCPSVVKERPGTSWMGPSAMGPPPGFDPSPLKSGQCDEDVEGPLQADDYAWLDGYTSPLKPESNNQRYQNWGLPKYLSDNGIWFSAADKSPFCSDDRGFPFPGMGFSEYHQVDDQPQKQSLDTQICEQLLQEHQSKRLGYVMEPTSMQFGSFQSLYEAQQQSHSQQQLLLLQQKQQESYRQYYTGGPFAS